MTKGLFNLSFDPFTNNLRPDDCLESFTEGKDKVT